MNVIKINLSPYFSGWTSIQNMTFTFLVHHLILALLGQLRTKYVSGNSNDFSAF